MDRPLFSILLPICDETAHLLPFTVESLRAQEFGSFELLVLDGEKEDHSATIFHSLDAASVRILTLPDLPLFSMVNVGVREAKGDYVLVLVPGEFYLSCHALSLIAERLKEADGPDLLTSGYVVRHSLAPPDVILDPLSPELLHSRHAPVSLASCALRRETLLASKGFDTQLRVQAAFEILCRLVASPLVRSVHFKRVLADYEYRRPTPRHVVRGFFETLRVVLRHFGLAKAMRFCLTQNHSRLFSWWWRSAKAAFLSKRHA
jgi:glycosyltransferase involved in cell wall biosynthesis